MAKVDWRSLAATLSDMTEAEVKRLLDEERAGRKRPLIARRLHQRYCMLRMARERDELMKELSA
jgi:hypothetical protein